MESTMLTKEEAAQVVYSANCDGETKPVIVYLPGARMFMNGPVSMLFPASLSETVNYIFTHGVYTSPMENAQDYGGLSFRGFRAFCEIKEFKTMADEIIAQARPELTVDEIVWRNVWNSHKRVPKIYRTGEIVGYHLSKTCSLEGEPSLTVVPLREFFEAESGAATITPETSMKKMDELSNFKALEKAVREVRKRLKRNGVLGATVHFAGNCYQI